MSKAAIPFALLVAALLVSSAPAFAKGEATARALANLRVTPATAVLERVKANTGQGGAGAGEGRPPGYTGHGGAGAGEGRPPGYTGHGGAGAGEGRPAVKNQPKS